MSNAPILDQILARGVLRVGTAITEPFEFRDPDTGDLIGFDVDTVQYIADKLGVKLDWVEMSFANLIPALEDRKVDMTIAAMYINPEREERVDFSEPYFNTGLVMVAQPKLQEQISTIDDLAGLIVGVKIGATGAALAQDLISQGINLESKEYKNTFDSFLDLEVGRVDVVFNDYLNSLAYIKDTQADFKIISHASGEIYFLSQVGLGIAVHSGDQELLDQINTTLVDMEADGIFDQLRTTWLVPISNR
ncbi:MAG: amino acid ABC transporter substrate-binding protein [Chloroflexi bacterium]|nr:amino acid ABC transporter substrate-binding protein [Chloroflexota bacterium]